MSGGVCVLCRPPKPALVKGYCLEHAKLRLRLLNENIQDCEERLKNLHEEMLVLIQALVDAGAKP